MWRAAAHRGTRTRCEIAGVIARAAAVVAEKPAVDAARGRVDEGARVSTRGAAGHASAAEIGGDDGEVEIVQASRDAGEGEPEDPRRVARSWSALTIDGVRSMTTRRSSARRSTISRQWRCVWLRPLIAGTISGFICGAVAGMAGLASHSMAAPGLFTSVQFFDPANPMTIVWVFGVMGLAVVLSFVLTLLLRV